MASSYGSHGTINGEAMGVNGSRIAPEPITPSATEQGLRRRTLLEHQNTAGWKGKLTSSIWHGGTWFDAWLSAVAAQVGNVILVFPYIFAQMGYGWGVGMQIVSGIFGCWTVYLLCWMYTELSTRKSTKETLDNRHILQYHEVIGGLAGRWAGYITKFFVIASLTFGCVLQVIANASDAYYLDNSWSKRTWTYVFGAMALLTIFIPSMHNLRILSFVGVVTTAFTAAYLSGAALKHGQVANVKHSGRKDNVQFFSGIVNIMSAFGSHGLCVEIMEAMYRPKNYNYAYILAILWTFCLVIPDSVAMYWAFGDILLHNSNAFGVLPPSKTRTTSILMMILHQNVVLVIASNPIFLVIEKAFGLHTSKRFALKWLVRVPVVLLIWLLALAIPFFGPINPVFGAFFICVGVYIIPCVAFTYAYRTKESRMNSVWKPSSWMMGWIGMFIVNIFIATWVLVLGVGIGGWATVTNLIRQIHKFGLFADCYQCPKK